jgi:hypothetical protein
VRSQNPSPFCILDYPHLELTSIQPRRWHRSTLQYEAPRLQQKIHDARTYLPTGPNIISRDNISEQFVYSGSFYGVYVTHTTMAISNYTGKASCVRSYLHLVYFVFGEIEGDYFISRKIPDSYLLGWIWRE